jgi:hypothetical protein
MHLECNVGHGHRIGVDDRDLESPEISDLEMRVARLGVIYDVSRPLGLGNPDVVRRLEDLA